MGYEPGAGVGGIQISLSQILLEDKWQPCQDGVRLSLHLHTGLYSKNGGASSFSVIVNSIAKAGAPPENSASGPNQYQPGHQDANLYHGCDPPTAIYVHAFLRCNQISSCAQVAFVQIVLTNQW